LTQWLAYWVLLALMNLCEAFKSTVLHWVPIYYPLKLSVIMWLMLPQCEGKLMALPCFIASIYRRGGYSCILHFIPTGSLTN